MIRVLAVFSCALFLSACGGVSMGAQHMGCMESYADFANQVACVRNALSNDPYMAGDTLVQEYLMTGDMLAAEVRAGRIGEDEARLRFMQKLNAVKQAALAQQAQRAQIQSAADLRFPRTTTCRPWGADVRCTTF